MALSKENQTIQQWLVSPSPSCYNDLSVLWQGLSTSRFDFFYFLSVMQLGQQNPPDIKVSFFRGFFSGFFFILIGLVFWPGLIDMFLSQNLREFLDLLIGF